jgi:poly-gamma-glutamate capsule biosynthesis protein CapA/YwtB (metallophosphatase superfamily)
LSQRPITLLLGGDVMLGRGVDQIMPHPSDPRLHEPQVRSALDYVALAEQTNGPIPRDVGFDYVWGEALSVWDALAPDLRIVNLETAVTRSGAVAPKQINYRMSPDHAACLTAARIDACALANNHVLDWSQAGLIETLAVLKRSGVASAGAGGTRVAARAPTVLSTAAGQRVLLIACATGDSGVPESWDAAPGRAGVNRIDLTEHAVDEIAASFGAVRRAGDIALVSIHWGPNFGYGVPEIRRRFAHALIDRAGVSVVHGHSAHHPQAAEVHDGRLVLYGCGDLINDYEGIGGLEEFRGDLVAAYAPSLDPATGALTSLAISAFRIRRFQLARASHEEFAWMHQRLAREYGRFGLQLNAGDDGLLRIELPRR